MVSFSVVPEHDRRTKRLWLVVVAIVLLGLGVVSFREYGLPLYRERSADRLTQEGVAALRDGDLRRAELSFESALAIRSESFEAGMLLARMLVVRGDRTRGETLFGTMLASSGGDQRDKILVAYHDALVAVGAWEQRARLAARELARSPENAILIVAVVESARLARWSAADAGQVLQGVPPEALWGRLLRAQCLLNDGQFAAAKRELDATGAVAPLLSLVKMRLWLQAGDPEAARLSLARVTASLDDVHVALGFVALAKDEPDQARRAVRELCRRPSFATQDGAVLEALLVLLFSFPDRAMADELTARLAPEARALDVGNLAGLWLYASLSGAERSAAIWYEQLGARSGRWPINLNGRKLDQQIALFAINSLPLSRLLVDGLLAAVPAPVASTSP